MVATNPLDQRRLKLEDILAQMLTIENSLCSLALELAQNLDNPDCIRDLHLARQDLRRSKASLLRWHPNRRR